MCERESAYAGASERITAKAYFTMRLLHDIRRLHWMTEQQQHHTVISSMLVILFIACFHVITTNAQQKGDEVCETLPSEIHLIKGD